MRRWPTLCPGFRRREQGNVESGRDLEYRWQHHYWDAVQWLAHLSLMVPMIRRGLVALAVTCAVAGCKVARVDDVHLIGIDLVKPQEERALADVEKWSSQGPLLKLMFAIKSDVRGLARQYDLNVRVEAYQCDNRGHLLAWLPHVFDQQGAISAYVSQSSRTSSSEVWIYVAEKAGQRKDIETGEAIPAYDLASQPVDICVQLHGFNMARQGFSSNVIVIPADQSKRFYCAGSRIARESMESCWQ